MAIKDLVDKALLSAFWGNASEKIDARIAAAKASAATESTAGLVKPGSGLAVASDGTLSAKVDDSTIGFNESGQLTALGGSSGITPFTIPSVLGLGLGSSVGRWTIYNPDYDSYDIRHSVTGFFGEDWIYIAGITLDRTQSNITSVSLINVFYDTNKTPYVNGIAVTNTDNYVSAIPISYVISANNVSRAVMKLKNAGYNSGVLMTCSTTISNYAPTDSLHLYCALNTLIIVK